MKVFDFTEVSEAVSLSDMVAEHDIFGIDHSKASETEDNLLKIAWRQPNMRPVVTSLANLGYYVYMRDGFVTWYVQHHRIPSFWHRIRKDKEYTYNGKLIYKLQPALQPSKQEKLLVVFSSMNDVYLCDSLLRHFTQNFPAVQKYIPQDTHVLRIADFGGITGAYYLDTHYLPQNSIHVQQLIQDIARKLGVVREKIVLYGGSKGGTGALYHGLVGGYQVVSIDPILSDAHYLERHKDLHMVTGIFPQAKEEIMTQVIPASAGNFDKVALVYSTKSPQFPYTRRLLLDHDRHHALTVFNTLNAEIKTHPDVSAKTINAVTALLNMKLYGVRVQSGHFDIV